MWGPGQRYQTHDHEMTEGSCSTGLRVHGQTLGRALAEGQPWLEPLLGPCRVVPVQTGTGAEQDHPSPLPWLPGGGASPSPGRSLGPGPAWPTSSWQMWCGQRPEPHPHRQPALASAYAAPPTWAEKGGQRIGGRLADPNPGQGMGGPQAWEQEGPQGMGWCFVTW